ncbi:hypothetical protein AKO1_002229 [Acrasis kona]|uniref:Uncharacterized protein n=1 Tax=Acrasis kona TaxID=1008807 RepID=A0AAW2ZSF5_9EUKA
MSANYKKMTRYLHDSPGHVRVLCGRFADEYQIQGITQGDEERILEDLRATNLIRKTKDTPYHIASTFVKKLLWRYYRLAPNKTIAVDYDGSKINFIDLLRPCKLV